MKEIKDIEKLFSEGLQNFEVPVNPELWSSISQGISAAGTSSASAGIGLASKLIIAVTAIGTIGVAAYFGFKEDKAENSTVVENSTISPEIVKEDAQLIEERVLNNTETTPTKEETSQELPNQTQESKRVPQDEKTAKGIESDETKQSEATVLEPKKQDEKTELGIDKTVPQEKTGEGVGENKTPNESKGVAKDENPKAPEVEKHEGDENNANHSDTQEANENLVAKGVFPNVFTPNNDGDNDYLEIKLEKEVSFFRIDVFTTRGELVYFSDDVNFRWDGNHLNGSPVPSGKYVYQIELKDLNGQKLKPIVRLVEIIR